MSNESNFSAAITEASRELTPRERVMFKDTQNALSMNEMAENAVKAGEKAIISDVKDYVVIKVHNEKSEDVDYDNFIVIDKDGNKYVTGSTSFWNAFKAIWDELKDETEPWGIQLNLIPSKNYAGRNVLTCSLI